MANEIEAIATNNYILATQQAVTHDNSLSGNGTVDSPLGLNETVLWEGPHTSGNISLSESITNFERIAILFAIETPNTSGTYNTSSKWIILDANSMYLTRKFHLSDTCNNGSDANTLIIRQQSYTIDNDNKGFTAFHSTQLYFNGTSWALAHNASYICKVIGINRKAQ